ncbi:MAG: NAD(P)H-binding protein [Pseudomonadota bacterium]
MRIALAGATGTIGQAVALTLSQDGHECIKCARADFLDVSKLSERLTGCDAVISCIASRTGAPQDAWAVDHDTNLVLLHSGKTVGINRFILLSAICVQKPKLAFQHAKSAFEEKLRASGVNATIIRPTAFFKSLSGQVSRVQSGKPFLVFGDGHLTACKPISDRDLARYIVNAIADPKATNQTLSIGGPGPALSPKEQAGLLSELLNSDVPVRHIPIGLIKGIIGVLSGLGFISSHFRQKAELARIGHYYGTESMLLWDHAHERYNADATPEFGEDTLRDHYANLLSGRVKHVSGDHAVF